MSRTPAVDQPTGIRVGRLPMEGRTPQDTSQVLVNERQLFVREIGDLAVRADTRLEADFVGVLVPNPGHDLLVHEESLERAAAARPGEMDEASRGKLFAEWIETQIVQDAQTTKVITFNEMDVTGRCGRSETQFAAGRELQANLTGLPGGSSLGLEVHFTVGAHVEYEADLRTKAEDHVFPMPFDGVYGMALDMLSGTVAIQVYGLLVVDQDHGNGFARRVSGKGVDHPLDVWQLYHILLFLARR